MKKIYIFICFFVCFSALAKDKDHARLRKAELQVDKIMELMDLPEYGVIKLGKKGLYTSKDYISAATDLMKFGRQMKDVDYPDAEFMKLTDEMLDSFKGYEEALKKKDPAQIKAKWDLVNDTCKKCHKLYE